MISSENYSEVIMDSFINLLSLRVVVVKKANWKLLYALKQDGRI